MIGREFWPGAPWRAAAGRGAALGLPAPPRAGAPGPDPPDRSSLAGEDQLRFHHILIRDVAYRSTPKSLRSELHEQFAEWLAPRGEVYDEFLGFHLEQAFSTGASWGSQTMHSRPLAGAGRGAPGDRRAPRPVRTRRPQRSARLLARSRRAMFEVQP